MTDGLFYCVDWGTFFGGTIFSYPLFKGSCDWPGGVAKWARDPTLIIKHKQECKWLHGMLLIQAL